jgi:hypothetical protein
MDPYLGEYMRKTYPILDSWPELSTFEKYNLVSGLDPREYAWVLVEKMGNLDEAKKVWLNRYCDNEKHHTCPHCEGDLSHSTWEARFHICMNDDCPYIDEEHGSNRWTGCNHGDVSDDSCGFFRWDKWDQ